MADKKAAGETAAARPELLSPAGDMERLRMALTYGADAVYLAGRRFGLRAGAGNFTDDALETAVKLCHGHGVPAYIACNAVMRGDDLRALPAWLERLQALGADAVILSDLGAFALAGKVAPTLRRHVSTQAGVTNAGSARMLYDMGASRVILARELTLGEIAEIRENTPAPLEIEAFVHGSMCMAFSGRCLLSNYMTGRDANGGDCAQPCRWRYHLIEEKRPGEYLEISEDEGTYIMNSRDLCMIDHLPELLAAGVTSLKIEGRAKSAYYAAAVTNAYRHALDAAVRGEEPPAVWREEMHKVSHRPYSTGFYFNREGPGQYSHDSVYVSGCDIAAVVESCDEDGLAVLTQRNKFSAGDRLELLTPGGAPIPFTAAGLRDENGAELGDARHPMMILRMALPRQAPRYSIIRRVKQEPILPNSV
jgi:putative protease